MHFHRIVVGVDFTEASLAAVHWVATHFAPDAEIVLAHVIAEPRVPSFLRSHLPPAREVTEAVAPALFGGLRGLSEMIGKDRARVEVVSGNAAEGLAQVADRVGADLVCVGRGRRRRGSARFGATTAQRLLSRTRIPTLVVPAVRLKSPERIVVAIDERPGDRHVLEVASGLAAALEARVDALHVVEPEVLTFLSASVPADAWADRPRRSGGARPTEAASPSFTNDGVQPRWVHDRARQWIDGMLDALRSRASRMDPAVASGDAGQEIIRHVRQHESDLVVVGRGGDASLATTPLGALPLGSTARLVLWVAPCPVLVVPLDASRRVQPPPSDWERRRRLGVEPIPLRAVRAERSEPLPPAAHRRSGMAEDGAA